MGTVSLTPASVYYRLREGRLYHLLHGSAAQLCLSLFHFPSRSVSPNLMTVRTNPPKDKEAVKVSHSATAQARSFKPVRRHPLMPICSESGPNEAQLSSAHQPQRLLASPAANFLTERLSRESNFHISVNSLLNLSTTGVGEFSYTRRWKPSCDEFGSGSRAPPALAAPRPLLQSVGIHGATASSQNVMFSRPRQQWKVVLSHVVSQLKLCLTGAFLW